MFESITATAAATSAASWSGELENVVLLVIGFSVFFILANWVIAKIRARRAGGKKRGKKRGKR